MSVVVSLLWEWLNLCPTMGDGGKRLFSSNVFKSGVGRVVDLVPVCGLLRRALSLVPELPMVKTTTMHWASVKPRRYRQPRFVVIVSG